MFRQSGITGKCLKNKGFSILYVLKNNIINNI